MLVNVRRGRKLTRRALGGCGTDCGADLDLMDADLLRPADADLLRPADADLLRPLVAAARPGGRCMYEMKVREGKG